MSISVRVRGKGLAGFPGEIIVLEYKKLDRLQNKAQYFHTFG